MSDQNKKGVTSFFNKDAYTGQRLPQYLVADSYYEKLFKHVEHLDWSGLVLDAGCGRGGFIWALGRHGINSIVGIDISNQSLQEARDTGAELVTADLEGLPFQDETFDVIFVAGVLYYFPRLANPLQELIRVLKSGGRFIAIEPNPSIFIKLSTGARRLLSRFINLDILQTPNLTIHNSEAYRTVLERSGFQNIQIVYVDMFVRTLKEEFLEFVRHPLNLSQLLLLGRVLLEKLFKILPPSQSHNNIKVITTKEVQGEDSGSH